MSPDGPSEARLFVKKTHLRSTLGKNRYHFFKKKSSPVSGVSGCQWGYSTQGALHVLGLARLRRAEQSPAEPSRAQQSRAKRAISLDPLLISGSSRGKQGAPAQKLPSSTSPFCLFALAARQHFSNQQMSTPFFFQSPLHFGYLDALVGITCFPLLSRFLGREGSLVGYSQCSDNKTSEVPATGFSITGLEVVLFFF